LVLGILKQCIRRNIYDSSKVKKKKVIKTFPRLKKNDQGGASLERKGKWAPKKKWLKKRGSEWLWKDRKRTVTT